MLYPPAYVGEELVSEREKRLKHLLHVLGARSVDYYLAQLCSDLALFVLPIVTALVVGAATNSPSFVGAFGLAAAALMLGFAVAISSMTYLVAFLFSSSKSVLKYLSTILLLATSLPLCILFSVSVALPNTANAAALVLSVFPALAMAWGLFNLSVTALLAHELERQVPLYNIFVRTPEGHFGAGWYVLVLLGSALAYFMAAVRRDLETYRHYKTHVHVPHEEGDDEAEDSDVVAERDSIERGGTALLAGKSIYSQLLEVFGVLGFCPQTDAVWEMLTGREHLLLACSLRGLPASRHAPVVSALLQDLGILAWADKLVKVYSGGTRRKLCVAMALVGGDDGFYLFFLFSHLSSYAAQVVCGNGSRWRRIFSNVSSVEALYCQICQGIDF
jgi:hypothetical protein